MEENKRSTEDSSTKDKQKEQHVAGGQNPESLSPSAQRYKVLTDSVPQIIWENNNLGEAIYFNRRWFEFSGLTYEDSLSVGWIAMSHPDDDSAITRWREALAAGTIFEAEVRLRKHDGEYIWHLLRNTPLIDPSGRISGWYGTATDIHEQKKTEILLHEASTTLRAILETAIDFAIITLDSDGRVIDWNSGATQMFGYSREEALGQRTEFLFTDEDIEAGIPQIELDKARNSGEAIDERWHRRKDGTRFFMSGVMKPIQHLYMSGYVKITREITDRKLAEEALFLTEQHKSLAVESAQMGEWTYDILENKLTGDDKSRELLGLAGVENGITIESVFEKVHEQDRRTVHEALDKALAGLYIFHAELRILKRDQPEDKWVSMYGRVVAHDNNRPSKLIGVIYDITTRKLLEKQKDDFISIASHELRSPVTSIKAYSELLEDAFEMQGDTENASLVRKLNTQVDRLVRLIHHLLDASNISQVALQLRPETFDINQLIDEIISGYISISGKSRLVFRRNQVALINADPQRIAQVIENLMSNALKYSPEDKEVIITTEDMLDSVKVSVQDFGWGIPYDQQQSIFERYYRVKDENVIYNQGLGLGLFIAAQIIRQHYGTINVISDPGKGSTFFFTLPYS